ncbi:hypothetical protein CAEBREN_01198 [Caenorhabditis brenneri]|uniref:BZIP domain-containing protein n=1 Tax=Caenorhabditis brenneri TaxID=135651 RepID=G0MYI3_CAEBE|nr:hypothetical protein CAEBREN_01198 [Caenorhabditis brenneri]
MAETDAEDGENDVYARFRRCIGETPDGGFREFRGTPGTVDVARGVDVHELVNGMMAARILHLKQILAGWEAMKGSLTSNNAGLIYSEMVGTLESLMKFEHSNSSNKNSWTQSRDRREFPPYLSDFPVLDGETRQATGSTDEEKLKLLFGDFATEQLIELFKEVDRKIRQRHDFERQNEHILATGTTWDTYTQATSGSLHQAPAASPPTYQQIATSSMQAPPVPAPPEFTQAEFPALPTSGPRACRGVGVRFNANREPTITAMGSNRIPTPAPPVARTLNSDIRPLMSLDVEPQTPWRRSGESSGPQISYVINTQDGEVSSLQRVRVDNLSSRDFASALSSLFPGIDERGRIAGRTQNSGTQGGHRRRRQRQLSQRAPPINTTVLPSLVNNSDSGLSSNSTQENSTRTDSPSTNTLDTETPVLTSSTSQADTAEMTDHEEVDEPEENEGSEEVNSFGGEDLTIQVPKSSLDISADTETSVQPVTPRGPSYASIVSNRTSSPLMSTSSRIDRFPALNEWVQVKNKHVAISKPVESAEKSLIPVQPKPAREERQSELAAVAEAWDDPEEEDPEREREREKRRLKNRNQRAAKKQRDKEAKRNRTESGSTSEVKPENGEVAPVNEEVAPEDDERAEAVMEDDTMDRNGEVDKAAEGTPIVSEKVPGVAEENSVVAGDDQVIAELVEELVAAVDTGYYDETGRYCDNATMAEPEKERLKHKDSHLADLHAEMNEHCKILFRILWFQNNNKLEKLRLNKEERDKLEERVVQCRRMMERIDMFGRLIMYRYAKQNIKEDVEENILHCGKNLLSIKHLYMFKILSLGTEFLPTLKEPDDRIARYKELVILAKLHVARVSKVYQELETLYRFQSKVVPQQNRSYRHL